MNKYNGDGSLKRMEDNGRYTTHYYTKSESEAWGLLYAAGRFAMSTGTDGGSTKLAGDIIIDLAERIKQERLEIIGGD